MASAPVTPSDPVFHQIDLLVRDGTLSPEQARRVYTRLAPTAADPGSWTLPLRAAGGVAVLGAAIALGALFVAYGLAQRQDFNWYAFLVVLIGAAALCGVAAIAAVLGAPRGHREWLASIVLATGLVAAALALLVALRDQDWSGYAVGALLVVAGAAAYWWLRGAALSAVVVLGGLILVSTLISDALSDGSDSILGPGFAITGYGIAVVAAGWPFASRHVTGVLGGILATLGMLLVTYFGAIFAFADGVEAHGDQLLPSGVSGDTWVAVIVGLVVAAGLTALYAYTDRLRYLVVAFVGASALVATGLGGLRTDHRLWLAVAFGAVGGLAVAAAVALVVLGRGGGARRAGRSAGASRFAR